MDVIPFLGISVWLVVKIAVLILLLLYIVFAFVIVKQVGLMIDTLSVGFEKPVRAISLFHLLFAISTFILAIIIL
ncbi:hypothetical protein A3D00_05435 [Candidatus Woesebacteria bacterium RIFCSPHIGHO2_02_FULL_38_9]|uniref:Uncharacterized protein n=1 Tax=Candidatus Woesebacteria bacterium RIFCSPHIGHO2_01_FULL_39_28 TaxID=1802496 RepID=A0A1F7YHY9_9BACT|nr:MAG: hypothetical protein A2627_05755 [Candidatus Woesebacteria bacterium RIFCSPHIGHO2_01_FULL_39_28]OGM33312.1 MAG: hypothetical protein A3D00_05435 [Candidatus Woesebacteria bacterium RIFCSPHIGHO2_02_FULL_38_9]OGM56675.1 MAG: hypothetical protein A3A50_04950 [Candidatus Woesebacteria bacterium RIFCSPLOWO2_01_FULL_38_20]